MLSEAEHCDKMNISIVTVEYLVEEDVTPIHQLAGASLAETDGRTERL